MIYDAVTMTQLEPDALNEYVGLTVSDIVALDECVCGHEVEAHFEDGLLEVPTGCADLGRDRQGCMCRSYRGRIEE